jgi:hypothetical protein
MRPTWAHIDEACQYGEHAEAHARTVAQRRSGGDRRLAEQAADAFKRGLRLLAQVEREDDDA